MQARHNAAVRLLRLALAASVLVPAALFAYASWLNRDATYAVADERIDRSLAVVHEHGLKIVQSTELALRAVNELLSGHDDAWIRANERELHDELGSIASNVSQIHALWVSDRDGNPLVASAVFPMPHTLNNAERDYFKAQRDKDAGTYIGEVVAPKIAGEPVFMVSRRRAAADGAFTGVVAAAIWPREIQQFYAQIGRPSGSYFAILRTDGLFLARYPEPGSVGLRLTDESEAMRAINRGADHGMFSVVSQTDGVKRRLGYRKLTGYPIYLLAGEDIAAIDADWLHVMGSHLVFGIPATALLIGAIALALRRTSELDAEAQRREEAESALRQSQKMEAIGQLTGGVAHDFNNLLTIIMGNIELALRGLDSRSDPALARIRRAVDSAKQGAERAASLIQRLLAFSRRQPLAPQPLNLDKLVRGMADLLRQAVGETIDLEIVGAAGLWNVEADPAQLESAILNVALNARDAMPSGGKLTIETGNAYLDADYCRRQTDATPGQYALVAITDTGGGMDPDVQSRAFDPFFTTKGAGQGTGLGLSQVYGFVKQSSGHVKIYSEMGHGTTVKVYLPRLHRELASPQQDRAEPTGAAAGGRILVVEDDAAVRSYVVETLRDIGYEVAEAGDGPAALQQLAEPAAKFDLLLTDVVLPGISGREVADEAQRLYPKLRILFMTGYSRNAIVHQGRLDPGVELLQKPFTAAALAARVQRVVNA